jgi:hypothetical protein
MIAGLSAPSGRTLASADSAYAMLPLVLGGIFAGFITLVVVVVVKAAQRENRRQEQLRAHALSCGWHPVPLGAPLPPPVVAAAGSRRSKLVLGTRIQGFDLWLVWHQWTESTSTGDSTTYSTHNLTRYFLWPGRPYPDVRLGRRTRIGASLMPKRGIGTGDTEFDKRFLVRGGPGTEPLGLLTPGLRQAMLAGNLPTWEIAGGVLTTAYNDIPSIENLQYRANLIVHIVRLLG